VILSLSSLLFVSAWQGPRCRLCTRGSHLERPWLWRIRLRTVSIRIWLWPWWYSTLRTRYLAVNRSFSVRLSRSIPRDYSDVNRAPFAACFCFLVDIDIVIDVATHASLEWISEPNTCLLLSIFDPSSQLVWQSRPEQEGRVWLWPLCLCTGPCPIFNAIHLLQVDLVPFYSVRFTWDRRTNWARLFFSQLQSGLVASFWCPRRTFRLPLWTIWSHKGRSLGRLVNPVNTTVVNHSVVNNQIAIHEATSANMETTSDASWYRRPCFRIVVLLLELLLVPWLSSIPCILYCLHCRWSWSEGNRAICEGRLAMQFAGYFL